MEGGKEHARPAGEVRGVVSFLHALGSTSPDALSDWLASDSLDAFGANWLQAQMLAAFTFHSLRAAGVLARLPADAQHSLQGAYYAAAAINVVQRRETEAVLRALDEAGIETVLMKGTPLAHTVYAEPACRLKGDLDIWLPPAQLPAAIAALRPSGYVPRDKSDRPAAFIALAGGEQQLIGRNPGTGLVELQWPAFRGEWVRRTAAVDHAAIWARRVAVPIEGRSTWAMAPEDLLIHLCLHLAINHGFGAPALRNLLDVHLVSVRLSPDWGAIAERARRVAACHDDVDDAQPGRTTLGQSRSRLRACRAATRPWTPSRYRIARSGGRCSGDAPRRLQLPTVRDSDAVDRPAA